MAINLLEVASSALGRQVLGQLAGALGETEEKTKSAIDIAAPALLGGLMKQASTPHGAQDLFNEAKRFDTGILDNLGSLISGGQSQESGLMSMGAKLLPMLLGPNLSSIIGMIAKLAGIGQGASKSLLGMLAPLLFGLIAKQVKSGGLDLKGFTDLIMGQKRHVAKSLPGDLGRQLGIANLLDQGVETARDTTYKVARAGQEAAGSGLGFLKTLIPLLLIAALAWAGWKFLFSRNAEDVADGVRNAAGQVADATTDAASRAADAVSDVIPDFDNLKLNLNNSFGDVTKAISEIADEASARAALPKLRELETQIEDLGWGAMSAPQQSALSGVLQPLVEKLQRALETVYAIPGVRAILEPAVNALTSKFEAMSFKTQP